MLGNNESEPKNKISGGGTKVKSLKNQRMYISISHNTHFLEQTGSLFNYMFVRSVVIHVKMHLAVLLISQIERENLLLILLGHCRLFGQL